MNDRIRFCEDAIRQIDDALDIVEKLTVDSHASLDEKVSDFLCRAVCLDSSEEETEVTPETISKEAGELLDAADEFEADNLLAKPGVERVLKNLREWLVEGVLEVDQRERRT